MRKLADGTRQALRDPSQVPAAKEVFWPQVNFSIVQREENTVVPPVAKILVENVSRRNPEGLESERSRETEREGLRVDFQIRWFMVLLDGAVRQGEAQGYIQVGNVYI